MHLSVKMSHRHQGSPLTQGCLVLLHQAYLLWFRQMPSKNTANVMSNQYIAHSSDQRENMVSDFDAPRLRRSHVLTWVLTYCKSIVPW